MLQDLFFSLFLFSLEYTNRQAQTGSKHTHKVGFDMTALNSIICSLRKPLKYWNAIFNHSFPSKKRMRKMIENDSIKKVIFSPF